MSTQIILKTPVITQAAVEAALDRARIERARAVQAVFSGLFQAIRRLGATAPIAAISTAAR